MISKSPFSNLLEQSQYKYSLQDVDEPNLYRDIYPYDEIPKVAFNHRRVPLNMPAEVWITDTTFRDGQQSRAPYAPNEILDIYKMLARLGGPNGIIRQSEFFVYTKKDREAVEKCMALGYKFPEITTWIRARKEDFALVRDIGIKETGILVSCSDYHIFKKLGMSRSQALNHYLGVIKDAFDAGIRPRCHLEDITRADFYGFVVPFVNEVTELSLEWHGHNDFHKAVANATSAWLYGASAVNCSLLGIGERTGNIPLEAMVIEYASIKGTFDGMDPTVITEIGNYYRDVLKYDIPPMTPFVGSNFNITRAGIHADGLMKDAEIYNIFDTEKILARPAEVSISNTSGLAGIAYWMNTHFGISGDAMLTKQDDIVIKMKEEIDLAYADGRTTIMADYELYEIAEKLSGGVYKKR